MLKTVQELDDDFSDKPWTLRKILYTIQDVLFCHSHRSLVKDLREALPKPDNIDDVNNDDAFPQASGTVNTAVVKFEEYDERTGKELFVEDLRSELEELCKDGFVQPRNVDKTPCKGPRKPLQGQIYAMRLREHPEYVKIGYTEGSVTARKRRLSKEYRLKLHTEYESKKVFHANRIESLIKVELGSCRWAMQRSPRHNEFYKLKTEDVKEALNTIVNRWSIWIKRNEPYIADPADGSCRWHWNPKAQSSLEKVLMKIKVMPQLSGANKSSLSTATIEVGASASTASERSNLEDNLSESSEHDVCSETGIGQDSDFVQVIDQANQECDAESMMQGETRDSTPETVEGQTDSKLAKLQETRQPTLAGPSPDCSEDSISLPPPEDALWESSYWAKKAGDHAAPATSSPLILLSPSDALRNSIRSATPANQNQPNMTIPVTPPSSGTQTPTKAVDTNGIFNRQGFREDSEIDETKVLLDWCFPIGNASARVSLVISPDLSPAVVNPSHDFNLTIRVRGDRANAEVMKTGIQFMRDQMRSMFPF